MPDEWPPMPVPKIPEQIRQAASEANLVIFVGAGVSRLMGCPSWNELAQGCLRQLAERELITFGDVEQLAHLDAKKKLTIALQVADAEGKGLDLPSLIQPQQVANSRVYDFLQRIGSAYITTNYDRFLDRDPIRTDSESAIASPSGSPSDSSELVCWPRQFTAQRLRTPGTVIHLHGSIDDRDSMVITTPDYLRHYDNPYVQQFLDELFDRFTVLFVGYGLEEWEVLEHILRKGRPSSGLQASRFMLSGFFSHQERTFSHLRRYYDDAFGVRLLPFSLDYRNYVQLEHVLEDWSGRLKVGDPLLADDLAFVLEVADE